MEEHSVTVRDVAVKFTVEEWALLDHTQKIQYRLVMWDTLRNLFSVGKKWKDSNIEGDDQRLLRNLRIYMILRICKSKEGLQCEESINPILNMNLTRETHTCRAACEGSSEQPRPCDGQRPHENQKPGGRLYKYKEREALGHRQCIEIRGSGRRGEQPREVKQGGRTGTLSRSFQRRERRRIRKQRYRCKECGKSFLYRGNRERHVRVHTGEKPYRCQVCGRGFVHRNTFKVHMNIHTKEKCYPCTVCGKTFLYSSALRVHEKNHSGEKPHTCRQCGKSFCSLTRLRHHGSTHSEEKPYICLVCGKDYKYRCSFRRHEKIHIGHELS